MTHTEVDAKLLRLKWRRAFGRWKRKAEQLVAAAKAGFDPGQPRVPAGNPGGGQWTSIGGSGSGGGQDEGRIVSDANPDNFWKPGAQVAQAGRRRATRRIIINGVAHTPTPGQAARHTAAETQARAAARRVREIDPGWKPQRGAVESIEGQIAQFRVEAREAEARLREFALQPPAQRIETYRALNNSRDLFGNETWPRNRDTVAITTIGRTPFAGVSSNAPTYTARDRETARVAVDTLVARYPNIMKRGNLGQKPNDALFHAEATVLLRAARIQRGSLAGQRFEVHTDRPMCRSCESVLPYLGRELGNPTVTFVDPNGVRRTMRDGFWID